MNQLYLLEVRPHHPGGTPPGLFGGDPVPPGFTKLHKRDPRHNLHRYYILDMQPHLFGGWSLIREWGRIGHPGQMKIDLCGSLEEATDAFRGKLRQKQRRGYAEAQRYN